jgi:hypothetical protein
MHPSSAATVYSSVAEAMLLGQHPHQALFRGSHCLTVLQLQCLARQSRATRKGARGSWGTRNKTIVVRENGLQLVAQVGGGLTPLQGPHWLTA